MGRVRSVDNGWNLSLSDIFKSRRKACMSLSECVYTKLELNHAAEAL